MRRGRRRSPTGSRPNSARTSSVRPGSDQAGDAEDLAAAQREGGAPDGRRRGEVDDLERARRPAASGARSGNSSSTGRPTMCAISSSLVTPASVPAGDAAAVAQHGEAIGDLAHLLEEVADVDDGHAARLEPPDQREEARRRPRAAGCWSARPSARSRAPRRRSRGRSRRPAARRAADRRRSAIGREIRGARSSRAASRPFARIARCDRASRRATARARAGCSRRRVRCGQSESSWWISAMPAWRASSGEAGA